MQRFIDLAPGGSHIESELISSNKAFLVSLAAVVKTRDIRLD